MPVRAAEGTSAGESTRVKCADNSSAHGPESLYGGHCIPYRRSCEGQAGRSDDGSPTATGPGHDTHHENTERSKPQDLVPCGNCAVLGRITEPSES